MAVDTKNIEITPYTSTVPLVQIPPSAMEQQTTPAQPLQGQFGKKGTGALAVGDSILKGFLAGHQEKEQRKYAQATATINAADKATQDAYSQYQDALSTNKDKTAQDAAYQQYVKTFNDAKAAKAQYVMPEKPAKGQPKSKDGKKQLPGMGGIKEFFEANPHIIPQIALMTMQPKPPGLTPEGQQTQNTLKEQQQNLTINDNTITQQQHQQEQQRKNEEQQQLTQQVEAAGGIDAVLNDKKADPKLQQQARQMKFTALDAQTPEGKIKSGLYQDVLSGASKSWTPEQKVLAGAFGLIQQPEVQTITGKNGHQQQILVDRVTNQPVPGSKPLDLGPPAWAQEFYAKQGIMHSEIERAVKSDPAAYGIQLGGDPKANEAQIQARIAQMQVTADFGIHSLTDMTGKTGYETQRDNLILSDVVKAAGLNSKGPSPLDSGEATMSYPIAVKGADGKEIPAGQSFAVGRDYFNKILSEFTATPGDNSGVRGFRANPENPDKKAPQVLEAERKFLYGWVRNQMLNQKGKNAYTPAQADAILKNTALGQPIVAGPMEKPPAQQQAAAPTDTGSSRRASMGLMEPPPTQTAQGKLYMIPGYSDPAYLTDDQVKKAQQNHIAIQEVDPNLLQQFAQ